MPINAPITNTIHFNPGQNLSYNRYTYKSLQQPKELVKTREYSITTLNICTLFYNEKACIHTRHNYYKYSLIRY